jgi:hypothetical protein
MELKAATIIGVPEGYIALKASGQSSRQVGQTYRHNSCPLVKANTGKIVCREPMHCLCRIWFDNICHFACWYFNRYF